MGAGNASTGGGGGGVGPAGMTGTTVVAGKTKRTYGTVKNAKTASRRNEFRTFIKEGGVPGKIIRTITGKTPYETNLERRQKFVKKKGLTGEEINLDPSYLGSKEGLKELRRQGYTTARDEMEASGNDSRNAGDKAAIEQQVMDSTYYRNLKGSKYYQEPKTVIKNIGGTEIQTTEDKLKEDYDTRKTKRKGRRQTILTSQKGATGNLVLGKPTLLGA
jgi:hypothetical protein